MNAHVRRGGIHVRALATLGAETIADGILDPEGDEFDAPERCSHRGDMDAEATCHVEQLGPGHIVCEPIDVLFVTILGAGNTAQHARGEARVEIDAVTSFQCAGKADAAGGCDDVFATAGRDLFCE